MKKIIIQNSKYAKEQEVGIMPLTMANIGEVNEIKRIGGNEETRRFLANLGFVAGAEITVVSAIGGNVIVNIKDSRVAVNSDMARHIIVFLLLMNLKPYTFSFSICIQSFNLYTNFFLHSMYHFLCLKSTFSQ